MKANILLLILFFTLSCNFVDAQTGYEYNPATGKYEYNPNSLDVLMEKHLEADSRRIQQTYQQIIDNEQQYLNFAMESERLNMLGGYRIQNGRATTRIATSAQGSLINLMIKNNPPAETEIRQSAGAALQAFNNLLKYKKMTPYDTADGNALAFVLAFEIYNGEDPGAVRLKKWGAAHRKSLLNDTYYQGKSEEQKQKEYEDLAIKTMYAWQAFQLSKQPKLAVKDQQKAKILARNSAYQILDVQWTPPVDGIELSDNENGFGDRSSRVLASGKVTTTFNRSNTVLLAPEYAAKYGKDESYYVNLMKTFDAETLRRGGKTNDAAWVNAIAFLFAYEIYTQRKVKLNDQQLNWVYREMNKDMLVHAQYQAYTNEGKQRYYEYVALEAMIVYDNYVQAASQERSYQRGTIMDKAVRGADALLVNIFNRRRFYQYELTPTGFVNKQN